MNAPLHRAWRLGLTGGIGSGKSTVAAMLAQAGAVVIDADAISRQLTAPGGAAIAAIAAAFGPELITPEGALDRTAMRDLVFAQPQARQRLEAIVHPLVAQATAERVQQAQSDGAACIVHDVPLLVEGAARWRPQLDRIWVVDCEPPTQVARVVARSGLAPEQVQRIMAQQATRAQRLACADAAIYNEAVDLAQLQAQVRQLALHFGL